MFLLFWMCFPTVLRLFRSRRRLLLENLALRQQLLVLQRNVRKPRLRAADRFFWIGLCRFWNGWNKMLLLVSPQTVVGWHRLGYRLFWRWRSCSPGGTAQQIVNAFPENTAPRYLIRDRDGIYGSDFVRRVRGLGIQQKLIAPRSPWQNPFVERLIGSIRRECLDHMIVFGAAHLHRTLSRFTDYYQNYRPHRSLAQDSPLPRAIEPQVQGRIIELPLLGGLHHRYTRQAA